MGGIDFSILWIISLITFILFVLMALNIFKISRNIEEINYVIKKWAFEKGFESETNTICDHCHKPYTYIENQKKKCPHCGFEPLTK